MIDKFDGKYSFLSNFYFSPIEIYDIGYPTVEHAFQAAKTLDKSLRKAIAAAPTPGQAKRMGRQVQLRPDWEEVKIGVMEHCLREKFKDPELRQKLLDTEDQYLQEGTTWHDRFWGVCSCERCQGQGENHLGYLLMKIRNEIKALL